MACLEPDLELEEPPPAALSTDYLVVGGGIAGVSCAELLLTLDPEASVTLVTDCHLVKAVTDLSHVTKLLSNFRVVERSAKEWGQEGGVRVVQGGVTALDPHSQTVTVEGVGKVGYGRLCLATGGRPRLVCRHPLVLGLRDVQSVLHLQAKLSAARRVLVLGNGGIATELVHELRGVEVVWVVRDETINSAFLDPGAGQFLIDRLEGGAGQGGAPSKRLQYKVRGAGEEGRGSALGPDWHLGINTGGAGAGRRVVLEQGTEVREVLEPEEAVTASLHTPEGWEEGGDWPLRVRLTSGRLYGCDFLVSATGVLPGGEVWREVLEVDREGGVLVDSLMHTSSHGVWAAGDLIAPNWQISQHWLHMRLWTQVGKSHYIISRR